MSDFGARVRKVRKERNMTLVKLAELCDRSEERRVGKECM